MARTKQMKRQQNKKAKNYDNQPQENNNNNLNNIMGRSCNRKQHQNFPQQSVGQILSQKNNNKMERGLPVKMSICYDLNHFVDLLHLLFQS